jgi:hypothetical protein
MEQAARYVFTSNFDVNFNHFSSLLQSHQQSRNKSNQSIGKGVEKSNRITMPYALTLLRRLGIPYDRFVQIYIEYSEGKITQNLFEEEEKCMNARTLDIRITNKQLQ